MMCVCVCYVFPWTDRSPAGNPGSQEGLAYFNLSTVLREVLPNWTRTSFGISL